MLGILQLINVPVLGQTKFLFYYYSYLNNFLKEATDAGKPLSSQDFAVIDTDPQAVDNIQCIWCGMFLSRF